MLNCAEPCQVKNQYQTCCQQLCSSSSDGNTCSLFKPLTNETNKVRNAYVCVSAQTRLRLPIGYGYGICLAAQAQQHCGKQLPTANYIINSGFCCFATFNWVIGGKEYKLFCNRQIAKISQNSLTQPCRLFCCYRLTQGLVGLDKPLVLL